MPVRDLVFRRLPPAFAAFTSLPVSVPSPPIRDVWFFTSNAPDLAHLNLQRLNTIRRASQPQQAVPLQISDRVFQRFVDLTGPVLLHQ